jgi:hypothetical protein
MQSVWSSFDEVHGLHTPTLCVTWHAYQNGRPNHSDGKKLEPERSPLRIVRKRPYEADIPLKVSILSYSIETRP